MTRIIAVLNQKGGVGKTTTVANLGAALARRGQRVLLLDLDPQANLTVHVGLEPRQPDNSTYSLLLGDHDLAAAIQDTGVPGLRIVPSTLALANAEIQLASAVGRELILREALETWLDPMPAFGGGETPAAGEADFILIDCPPSLGIITMNALCSATDVLLPIQAEFFALQGVAGLLESLKAVQRLNRRARLSLVVPCMVDLRTNLARDVVQEVRQYFGNLVSGTLIRKNVALAEAPSHGKTIFEYAPGSRGAKDYDNLAREILGDRVEPYDITPKTRGMVYDDAPAVPDEAADEDEDVRASAELQDEVVPVVEAAPEPEIAHEDEPELLDEPPTVALTPVPDLVEERRRLQDTGPVEDDEPETEDLSTTMDELHARLHEALAEMPDEDPSDATVPEAVAEVVAPEPVVSESSVASEETTDEPEEGAAWIAAAPAENDVSEAEAVVPAAPAATVDTVEDEPEPTAAPETRLRLVEDAKDEAPAAETVAAAVTSSPEPVERRDETPKRSVWTRWLGL